MYEGLRAPRCDSAGLLLCRDPDRPRPGLMAAVGTGLRNGTDTTRLVGYLGFQFFTGQ